MKTISAYERTHTVSYYYGDAQKSRFGLSIAQPKTPETNANKRTKNIDTEKMNGFKLLLRNWCTVCFICI